MVRASNEKVINHCNYALKWIQSLLIICKMKTK